MYAERDATLQKSLAKFSSSSGASENNTSLAGWSAFWISDPECGKQHDKDREIMNPTTYRTTGCLSNFCILIHIFQVFTKRRGWYRTLQLLILREKKKFKKYVYQYSHRQIIFPINLSAGTPLISISNIGLCIIVNFANAGSVWIILMARVWSWDPTITQVIRRLHSELYTLPVAFNLVRWESEARDSMDNSQEIKHELNEILFLFLFNIFVEFIIKSMC